MIYIRDMCSLCVELRAVILGFVIWKHGWREITRCQNTPNENIEIYTKWITGLHSLVLLTCQLLLRKSESMRSPESITICYQHLSWRDFGVLGARIIKGYGIALGSHGTNFTHVVMEHDQIFSFFNSTTSTHRHTEGGVLTIFCLPSQ
jgi:hypothetical protein